MARPEDSKRLLDLLREFRVLERKRVGEGVSPLEYQRWLDLRQRIEKAVPQSGPPAGGERRRGPRLPTRMQVSLRTQRHLRDAIIDNVSHRGVFISTPFAAEIGTRLMLRLQIAETGESIDVPCEVVSNNVDGRLSTQHLGMGLRFGRLDEEQQKAVDDLFSAALSVQVDD